MKYKLSLAIILLFKIFLLKADCELNKNDEKLILDCTNVTDLNQIENIINDVHILNELNIQNSKIELTKSILKNVEKFQIENSAILNIHPNYFQDANILRKISFNNNKINSFGNLNIEPVYDSLDEFIFTGNTFDNEIGKLLKQLEILRFLKYLDLSSNKMTSNSILRYNFPQSLDKLFLKHNLIDSNGFRLFNNLNLLTELHLDDNQINRIENRYFDSLNNLQILSLANNYIKRIPSKVFFNLRNLKMINFQKNEIDLIDDFAFSIESDLHSGFDSIDLSDNEISNLPTDCIFCSHDPSKKININNLNIKNNKIFDTSIILKVNEKNSINGKKPCLDINDFTCKCNLNKLNTIFHIKGNCLSITTSFRMNVSDYLATYCNISSKSETTTLTPTSTTTTTKIILTSTVSSTNITTTTSLWTTPERVSDRGEKVKTK